MKCGDFERLIALYMGGDLPERQRGGGEQHLNACAACRQFAEGLATTRVILRSLAQESIDPAVYQQMRSRVLEQIATAPQRPVIPVWRLALFAAAAVLVVIVALVRFSLRQVEPPTRVALPPPVVRLPELPRAVRQVKRPRRTRQTPHLQIARTEPVLVKIVTDDPDVVIYWLMD